MKKKYPLNPFAYYAVFLFHLAFIVAAFLSPLFLNWRWIFVGVLCYYVQSYIFGTCVLTKIQFKGQQDSFYNYYLNRFGFSPNKRTLFFLSKHGFPWLIFLAAFIHQV